MLRGAAISDRVAKLASTIEREILVLTEPPFSTPVEDNVACVESVKHHRARSIYEIGLLEDPAIAESIRLFVDAGEEARFVDELPLKLAIVDERTVMFTLEDPVAAGGDLTMMVVEHPSLARTLKMTFEAVWDRGVRLDEADAAKSQ